MITRNYSVVLLLIIFCINNITGQIISYPIHGATAWIAPGYSTFINSTKNSSNLGFIGINIGAAYELTFAQNWNFSCGAEYSSLNSSLKIKPFATERAMIDTQGDEFTMQYYFKNYKEYQFSNSINIPITFGYISNVQYIPGFFVQKIFAQQGFYANLGIKISFIFNSFYHTTVRPMTTKGIYEKFIDPFEKMPNHYLTDVNIKQTTPADLSTINGIITAEIGYNFIAPDNKTALRIGIFCDYGILNLIKKKSYGKDLFVYSQENPLDIHFNSALQSTLNSKNYANSMMIGIKGTIYLKLKSTCRCYNKL